MRDSREVNSFNRATPLFQSHAGRREVRYSSVASVPATVLTHIKQHAYLGERNATLWECRIGRSLEALTAR